MNKLINLEKPKLGALQTIVHPNNKELSSWVGLFQKYALLSCNISDGLQDCITVISTTPSC